MGQFWPLLCRLGVGEYNSGMRKPVIDYPTRWSYRVIGINSVELRADIHERLEDFEYVLEDGNESRSGKFISMMVTLIVENEPMRDRIFQNLSNIPHVHMVL